MLTEVDGLASIIISKGTRGIDDEIIQNTKMSEVTDSIGVDIKFLSYRSVCKNAQARMHQKGKKAQAHAYRRSTKNRHSRSIDPQQIHQKYYADA